MRQFTASADGRRLAFYRMQQIETMPLLELDARGDSAGVRHVASQHWPGTRPCAWTRDGSRIVFSVGQSTGDRDIYIRDVATGVDRSFVKTDAFEIPQCLTPDGEDLIFWQGDRLRSRALSGGPAVDVLRAPESTVHPDDTVLCPAEGDQPCVIATIERTTIVFRELEVEDGTLGPEIARIEVATDAIDQMVDFDLSPDGTRVAVAECVDPFYRLRIVDLRDGSIDELERDWSGRGPQYLAWSRDGRWLCITGMSEGVFWLRRLDLDGGSRHLWGSYDAWPSHPVPSPDGTRIAFRAWRSPADVWMIEDF
jgi:hypothetical protein